MPVHPQRSLGLCSNGLLPPRIPLDPLRLRRPDNQNMELAKQVADMYNDWSQPLRYVRTVSSQRRLDCLSIVGSVSQSVGYLRPEEKALCTNINDI